MKKFLFGLITLSVGILSSCTNDDIEINVAQTSIPNALTISVDPSNFYSGYTFDDTKHNIDQIAEAYRTFYSESKMLIQVRTLIYDKATEELVGSIVNYITNTNTITESIDLLPGDYYAITTLSFATQKKESYWTLIDEKNIHTAKLRPRNRSSKWSILSQSTEEFSVTNTQKAYINTIPMPLGALVYLYFQNFQYMNEASYGDVADNKIRNIALYTKRRADSYNLDPKASSKYNYAEETGENGWYINESVKPSDFSDSWTFFETNLYSYCYILEPEQTTVFGYKSEDDTKFHSYGEQKTTFTSGITYLAYWDYFKIGNPYLGVADNNHWNNYTITQLYKIPYTEWGATLSTVKKHMNTNNYSLIVEDKTYLMYDGKFSELYSVYDFSNSGTLDLIDIVFDSSVTISALTDFVAKNADARYYGTSNDGTIMYLTNDGKSTIAIAPLTLDDGTTINIVEYTKNTDIIDYITLVDFKLRLDDCKRSKFLTKHLTKLNVIKH